MEGGKRPYFDGLDFGSTSEDDTGGLERPLSVEDVEAALKSCNGDKASGSRRDHRMSMAFLEAGWEFLGMMHCVHEYNF